MSTAENDLLGRTPTEMFVAGKWIPGSRDTFPVHGEVIAEVADAVGRGAVVRTVGSRVDGPGNFYRPTVLTDVPPDSEVMSQEIFGPVLPIATFTSEEQAIELANSTPYGLVGYACTRDTRRGQRQIEEIETGMMGLPNTP